MIWKIHFLECLLHYYLLNIEFPEKTESLILLVSAFCFIVNPSEIDIIISDFFFKFVCVIDCGDVV